ncbi:MAG: hypothetical protein L0210_14595 [Rhodospirillales bacterium]|nr:hypothetical protein [Rhodospirillales bacterium]
MATAVVLFLCLSGTAAAAEAERLASAKRAFAALDSDGDQQVTYEEFATKKILVFSARDRNGDNYLGPEEVRLTPEQFSAVDRDGDSVISGLEFIDSPYGQFDAYDRDRSGTMDLQEFVEVLVGS